MGAVVPVEGDKVIIAAGHVVEVDGTYTAGDDSVTATLPNAAINIYGTLKASRTVNSSLTGKGLILCNYGTSGFDYGTEADPLPSGITATLILNKAVTPAIRMGLAQLSTVSGTGNFINNSFWSLDTRVRGVKLLSTATAGTSTIELESSAHNWRNGDELMFMKTTSTTATDDTETRTILSISGATITLSSALTYTHLVGLPIGNLTCDITIKSYNEVAGQQGYINTGMPGYSVSNATLGYYWAFGGVAFNNLSSGSGVNQGVFGNSSFGNPGTRNYGTKFTRCASKLTLTGYTSPFTQYSANKPIPVTDFVILTNGAFSYVAQNLSVQNMYAACSQVHGSSGGSNIYSNSYFGFRNSNSTALQAMTGSVFNNCYLFGVSQSIIGNGSSNPGGFTLVGCDLGYTFPYGAKNGGNDALYRIDVYTYGLTKTTFENCLFGSSLLLPLTNINTIGNQYSQLSNLSETEFINKNNDVTQQEIYYASHILRRENTLFNRSSSSTIIKPIAVGVDSIRTKELPCANGASVRVIGYVQVDTGYYNGGGAGWNAPTVTLSGLGATTQTFTATSASNGAWEQYDLTITNSSGVDGNFVLSYTANAKTSSTGQVYFDGVPDSPFVTKCRHYGFTFDESNPARTVNPVSLVSEATAAAYTGVTVSASQITVGAGTTDTWAKLYAYTQAYYCANLSSVVNLTSSDGNTFGLPLTYKLLWPSMGNDGTLSGGWLLLATPGTLNYKLSGTKIEFQTAGSYTMTGSTFSGTVELVNTSGGAVTVYLPSGTSYTNTGPSITVLAPIVQQSVTLTGVTAGSRVQIYDVTNSIELFNDTTGYSWTDTLAAIAPRAIRIRIAYVSGVTAKDFVEANIGTCGTTSGDAGISYLADQRDDATYNSNAVNGSAVTGITFTDSAIDLVNCNIAGGAVTWPTIYAAFVYWNSTATGIANDFTYVAAPDTANYLLTSMKVKNTSAGIPLSITGGYGRSATTGLSSDIIDTSGGFIFLAPDHVVPYATGSGVTAGDKTDIAAAVLSAASATPITANVKKVNDVTLAGTGVPGDSMRPA